MGRRKGKTIGYRVYDNPPMKFMMHTRAERKMLPSRQPARGAAARSASLEIGPDGIFRPVLYSLIKKVICSVSP